MALFIRMVRRRANVSDPQVVRALALLMEMARARRGVLLKQFAEKRGYPLRAVYRSRDVLVKAGAPIQQNPESPARWQLMEGWLPPSVVGANRDELMALFVARQLAPGLRNTVVGRSLEGLWSRLVSPGPQQAIPLAAMPLSIRALSAIDYGGHQRTIDALTHAIEQRHAVRIRYRTPDATTSERVVEPGFLHWDGGLDAMYVPSWCRLRAAIRVFAVHRIQVIELLPTEPAHSVPGRRTIERAFRIWYRDTIERVTVEFAPRVAGEIRERTWHTSQQLTDRVDGGVTLQLELSAPEELERWLLGFGPDARVVEPARLADRVSSLHSLAATGSPVIEASKARLRRIKPARALSRIGRARRS